jgi:hypothetical protein
VLNHSYASPQPSDAGKAINIRQLAAPVVIGARHPDLGQDTPGSLTGGAPTAGVREAARLVSPGAHRLAEPPAINALLKPTPLQGVP